MFEAIKKTQLRLINNSCENIIADNKNIRIGGVGDWWEDKQDIDAAVSDSLEDSFTILLCHNPDYINFIEDSYLKKIDLILCGHTHGGQISFLGWITAIPGSSSGREYLYGFKHKKNTNIIISSGIGTVIYPIRFLARPEIVTIEILSDK